MCAPGGAREAAPKRKLGLLDRLLGRRQRLHTEPAPAPPPAVPERPPAAPGGAETLGPAPAAPPAAWVLVPPATTVPVLPVMEAALPAVVAAPVPPAEQAAVLPAVEVLAPLVAREVAALLAAGVRAGEAPVTLALPAEGQAAAGEPGGAADEAAAPDYGCPPEWPMPQALGPSTERPKPAHWGEENGELQTLAPAPPQGPAWVPDWGCPPLQEVPQLPIPSGAERGPAHWGEGERADAPRGPEWSYYGCPELTEVGWATWMVPLPPA